MEAILFSLVVSFCSPLVCEEYVLDSSLTQDDCTSAQRLAEGLYMNINNRVLYAHYADSYQADYMQGYPDITERDVSCKQDY